MPLEYSIKALESLKCFKPVLILMLIKNWYFASYGSLVYQWTFTIPGLGIIRLNNEFIFPDYEPPVINIQYRWSGICDPLALCSLSFSFVASSKLINFCIILLYCHI